MPIALRWLVAAACMAVLGTLVFVVAPLAAATPTITLLAPTEPQPGDAIIAIPIQISQVENLGAWEFDLRYDPALVEVVGMTVEPFFGAEFDCAPAGQRCALALGPLRETPGNAALGAISYGAPAGPSGEGVIAVLHLRPRGSSGTTALTLQNALISDAAANPQIPAVQAASLTIEALNTVFLPTVTR